MARTKGLLGISQNFEPEIASAFDARANVPTKADLTIASNWTANDGGSYLYNGMTVTVAEDSTPSNNGIYILLDKDNITDINSWQQVGEDFPYTGSAQITGSLGVTGSLTITEPRLSIDSTSISGSIIIGTPPNDTGSLSLVIGRNALTNYTGSDDDEGTQLAIGNNALSSSIQPYNSAIGFSALEFLGLDPEPGNSYGPQYNTSIGNKAGQRWLGNTGIWIGESAGPGPNFAYGQYNIGIGPLSLFSLSGSRSNHNTALGGASLYQMEQGTGNTGIGLLSLQALKTGNNNTGIGIRSINSLESGSNNIVIGSQLSGITTGSNNIVIGTLDNLGIGSEVNNNLIFTSNTDILYRYNGTNTTIYSDLISSGSGNFTDGLTVTGSLTVSGSSTFTNIGPAVLSGSAQITGSLGVSGSVGFSTLISTLGFWSTQTSLSTARYALGGAGDQNAGLAFGGYNPNCSPANFNSTEEFNGNTWSNSNTLNTARAWTAGFGSQNAAGALGGNTNSYYPAATPVFSCTEHYNGNTWSNSDSLNTARSGLAAAGTQNATLAFGGYDTLNEFSPLTEAYNGLSWSAVNTLNDGRFALAGGGTQNSSLAFGGNCDFFFCYTEEWNGTTWSNLSSLSNPRYSLGGAVTSTNSALAFGGYGDNGEVNCTEEWDGTTWTTQGGLTNTRYSLGGTGNTSTALAFGGYYRNGGVVTSFTEAYTPSFSTQCSFLSFNPTTQKINIADGNITGSLSGNLTGSVKLTSGDIIVPSGFELQADEACFINNFQSFGSSKLNTATFSSDIKTYGNTELKGCLTHNVNQFNPSAFSNGGPLSTGRSYLGGAGGSVNSALAFGGGNFDGSVSCTCTEEYNGTSWSTGGALNLGRYCLAGTGAQNSAMAISGLITSQNRSSICCTEEYNGVSWSTGNTLTNPRIKPAAVGQTISRTIIFGGEGVNNNCPCSNTEEYDGTSWSTSSPMPQSFKGNTGMGRGRFYSNFSVGGRNQIFGNATSYALCLNGTTWSYINNITSPVSFGVGMGYTIGYIFSGRDGFYFDGTGFSKGSNLLTDAPTTTRASNGSFNSNQNAGVIFGGLGSVVSCTEEFNNLISNTTPFCVDLDGNISNSGNLIFTQVSSSLDFIDDTAAAAGGVPLGGIYRSGSLIRIRLV